MGEKDGDLPLTPLSMAILLALADGRRHGYALMQEIEEQTEGTLKPGTGSLYAGLQRLADERLIRDAPSAPGDDRRRRYYEITERGRELARAEALRMLRVLNVAAKKNLTVGPTALESR